MKKLDVSAITDLSQFPIKKGTLQFLQDSNSEVFAAILIGLIGSGYSATTAYVLYGCVNSGAGSTYIISEGAVLYGGEVFLVDSATFTIAGANVAVLSIVTTQYTTDADPVTFTDNTPRNVHNIRKVVIASGTTGSGISNYANVVFGLTASTSKQGMVELATLDQVKAGTDTEMHLSQAYPLVVQPSSLVAYTGRLATKQIALPEWNMATTDHITINHGLTWPSFSYAGNKTTFRILNIRVTIICYVDETGDLDLEAGMSAADTSKQGFVSNINNTSIDLYRKTGGFFDNGILYGDDAGTPPRGYMLITYIPD